MTPAPRRARLRALAKINLSLKVLGRRPDGFHELRTVFQTISLADTIDVEFTPFRRANIQLSSSVDIPGNLVLTSSRLVMDAMGVHGHLSIRLHKRIPIGGGLGGGSSDAAAMLLALPVLAGRKLPLDGLLELAAELGSDVPFFLLGGTALGLGRGVELYPLAEGPAGAGLVVVPSVRVETAEAYRALGRELTTASGFNMIDNFRALAWRLAQGRPRRGWAAFCENDFEAVVFERHPQLRTLKQKLLKLGAEPAMLSGSGSAVFGIFNTRGDCQRASAVFGEEKVEAISLVSRQRYCALWWRSLRRHMDGKQWPPQSRYGQ